jgi:hypothetical protein
MKSLLIGLFAGFIFLLFSGNMQAQFDDVYYSAKQDQAFVASFRNAPSVSDRTEERYAGPEENENLDEYSYSSRINRFHRNNRSGCNYHNFDTWWGGYDAYSPYYGYGHSFGTGMWGHAGFGYSPFSSWAYSPWNSFGWNSWNPGWGFHSLNNWGYTPYSMYNWPYYGGYGNNYFINNYYGFGSPWVNHGWNGGEPSDRRFESRKGGSVSSSVKGRDASPRRVLVSGDNQKEERTSVGSDASTTARTSKEDRVRKSGSSSSGLGATEQNAGRTRNANNSNDAVRTRDSYNNRSLQDDYRQESSPSRSSWDNSSSRSSGFGNSGSSRSSGSAPTHSGGGGGSRRGGGF